MQEVQIRSAIGDEVKAQVLAKELKAWINPVPGF